MNLIVKCYQDDSQLHYKRLYNNDLMYYFDPCKHGIFPLQLIGILMCSWSNM